MPEETSLIESYAEIMTKEQIKEFISDWIAPAASVIVVIAAILGAVRYFIHNEVSDLRSNIQQLTSDVGSLNSGIEKSNGKLDEQTQRLDKRIDDVLTKALERAFSLPQNSKGKISGSLNEMRGILKLAEDQHIRLNPQLIETYGRQVIKLANDQSISTTAWETSLSLLNYRSSLNADLAPSFSDIKMLNRSGGPNFEINFKPLLPPPARYFPPHAVILGFLLMTEGSLVPPDKAAVLERISKPVTSRGNFEYYIFEGMGGTLTLDDQRMKNVIVRNCVIDYNGGATILENVYFVHCIFRIRYTLNGAHLGDELLASASTRFTTPA